MKTCDVNPLDLTSQALITAWSYAAYDPGDSSGSGDGPRAESDVSGSREPFGSRAWSS